MAISIPSGLNQEIQVSSKVSVVPFTAQCVDSLGRLTRSWHGRTLSVARLELIK